MNSANYDNEKRKSRLWPLFLLLFTSVDTVLFGTNANKLFLYIPRFVALFIIISLPFIQSRKRGTLSFDKYSMSFFLLMIVSFCVSNFYNHEAFETFASRILAIVVAFIVTCCYSEEDYFKAFDKFIYLVSICAIITEIIAYVIPSFFIAFPSITNTVGSRFFVYFFGSMEQANLGRTIIRANGIFWEPGAFSIYLIIGIMNQLFGIGEINNRHLFVYIMALLLTFSTTGYVSLAFVILVFVFSKRTDLLSKRVKGVLIIGSVLIVIGSILLDNNLIQNMVLGKLISGTSSATTRYSSLFNGMKVAIDHPLFGVGSNFRPYMLEYVQSSIFNNGGTSITNTIVAQFACYGSIFGLLFFVGTIRFFKKWSTNMREWVALAIAILLAYSGERFFSFMPFVFVFYGFCKGAFRKDVLKGNML